MAQAVFQAYRDLGFIFDVEKVDGENPYLNFHYFDHVKKRHERFVSFQQDCSEKVITVLRSVFQPAVNQLVDYLANGTITRVVISGVEHGICLKSNEMSIAFILKGSLVDIKVKFVDTQPDPHAMYQMAVDAIKAVAENQPEGKIRLETKIDVDKATMGPHRLTCHNKFEDFEIVGETISKALHSAFDELKRTKYAWARDRFATYTHLGIITASFADCFESCDDGWIYSVPYIARPYSDRVPTVVGYVTNTDGMPYPEPDDCLLKVLKEINRKIPQQWQDLAKLIEDEKIILDQVGFNGAIFKKRCYVKLAYTQSDVDIINKVFLFRISANSFRARCVVYQTLMDDILGLKKVIKLFKLVTETGIASNFRIRIERPSTQVLRVATSCFTNGTFANETHLMASRNWHAVYLDLVTADLKSWVGNKAWEFIGLIKANPGHNIRLIHVDGHEYALWIGDKKFAVSTGSRRATYEQATRLMTEYLSDVGSRSVEPLSTAPTQDPAPALELVPDLIPTLAPTQDLASIPAPTPYLTFLLPAAPQPTIFFRSERVDNVGVYRIVNFNKDTMTAEVDHLTGSARLRSTQGDTIVEMDPIYTFPAGSSSDEWTKAVFELGKKFSDQHRYMILTSYEYPNSARMAEETFKRLF